MTDFLEQHQWNQGTPSAQAAYDARLQRAMADSHAKVEARRMADEAIKARRVEEQAERQAFLQRVRAQREAYARGEQVAPPATLTNVRDQERAARQEVEKQREQAARQGMNDFVLHHLPPNDPKLVAYRQAVINGNSEA